MSETIDRLKELYEKAGFDQEGAPDWDAADEFHDAVVNDFPRIVQEVAELERLADYWKERTENAWKREDKWGMDMIESCMESAALQREVADLEERIKGMQEKLANQWSTE